MAGPENKGYKRSWKNLLLNKRYQLRFTLFMVGLSAVLMAGLGVWVMKEANETTTIAMAQIHGVACTKVPALSDPDQDSAPVPMKLDDAPAPPNGSGANGGSAAGSDAPAAAVVPPAAVPAHGAKPAPATDASAAEHHVAVQIDESSMTLTFTMPANFADMIVDHWKCELAQAGALDQLARRRTHILWVLIATGLALILGLAVYGIKMTHKVAGPLFKVSLYLAKMRDGRLDKVWNLRKGDQLVEFYDHFKAAHAGVCKAEREEIDHLKTVIAAAEAAGAGDHGSITELRTLVARKEKALE